MKYYRFYFKLNHIKNKITFFQISFKSSHVGSCSKFKLLSNGSTECMKIRDPHDGHLTNDSVVSQISMSQKTYGNALSKDLDANGYK